MRHSLLVVCLAAIAPSIASQQQLTIPSGFDTVEGGGSSPIAPSAIAGSIQRIQMVYGNTNFSSLAGPISINGISLRADGGTTWTETGNVTTLVFLSTRNPLDPLANNFLENHGPDKVSLSNTATLMATSGTTPNDTVLEVTSDSTFGFDPADGRDLVIELMVLGLSTSPTIDIAPNSNDSWRIGWPGQIDRNIPILTLNYLDGGTATSTIVGSECGHSHPAIGESFDASNPFDMQAPGFHWRASLSGPSYALAPGLSPFVQPTSAPIPVRTDVTLPWSMPIPGGQSTQLVRPDHGFVNLLGGSPVSAPDDLRFGPPRIMPLALTFESQSVFAESDPTNPDLFHITWVDAQPFGTPTERNTFQVSLHRLGDIEVKYANIESNRGFVGLTPGLGLQFSNRQDFSAAVLDGWAPGPERFGPQLRTSDRPVLGTTVALDLWTGPSPTAASVWLSLSERTPALDLGPFGMTNCELYVGPLLHAAPLTLQSSVTSLPISIPNNPLFSGVDLMAQGVVAMSTQTALPVATSNALRLSIYEN